MTQEVFFRTFVSLSLLALEVEDEEHGSSTPYAVIALRFCSLGNLHSEYLTCWSTSGIYGPLSIYLLSRIPSNSTFAQNLPKTVKQLRTMDINVDSFTKFVVCSLCHSIYDSDVGLISSSSLTLSCHIINNSLPNDIITTFFIYSYNTSTN